MRQCALSNWSAIAVKVGTLLIAGGPQNISVRLVQCDHASAGDNFIGRGDEKKLVALRAGTGEQRASGVGGPEEVIRGLRGFDARRRIFISWRRW